MNLAATRSRASRRVNLPPRSWPSSVAVGNPLVSFVHYLRQHLVLALFSSTLTTTNFNGKFESYCRFQSRSTFVLSRYFKSRRCRQVSPVGLLPPQNTMYLPKPCAVTLRTRCAVAALELLPCPRPKDELTPFKDTRMSSTSRTDIEASKHYQDVSIDKNFLSNHLRQPPLTSAWLKRASKPSIEEIKRAGSNSNVLYIPLSRLLSAYSERVHGQCS